MDRWTFSLRRFRHLAIVTTVGLGLLVVAGGVVRLTGSGLGCDDWPNCNSARFVDVSSGHTAIEQINRLFSALMGLPTIALAIAAYRVRPRRTDLRAPAIGVLVTVLANGVIGGIAVRGDLHPALVQSHFLLAMGSIAFGVVAIGRSTPSGDLDAPIDDSGPDELAAVSDTTRTIAFAVGAATALALVTGTVVTGTGPHAGDEDVRRFGFDISTVARIHSITVLVAIALALALAWRLQGRAPERQTLGSVLSAWVFVGLVQAGVGYTQYFNGVPEVLVGAHLALATGLWGVTVWLVWRANTTAVKRVSRRIPTQVVTSA